MRVIRLRYSRKLVFNLISKFNNLFSKGHERSIRAKKNIAASFMIKGASIVVGLALLPLTINYLEPTKYGIWITLSSIVGWFSFFDIGLGNGLRNRLAEALALGKHEIARIYISTAYAILTLVIGAVLVIFYVINPLLNWSIILNAGENLVLKSELSILALFMFTFFCLKFIFNLIATILTADQRPARAASFDLLGKLISLVLIFFLAKTTKGSLVYIGLIVSGIPVVVLFLSNIWFFNGKYKAYKPSIEAIDFSKGKDLLNLGVKFFIIQGASIILYETNNIIISHLFGPEQVTPYSVAFKYFSILLMGFSIIIAPFWSAFTEAWVKKEVKWIKNIMQKLIALWSLLLLAGIIMLITSKWVYGIWLGDKIIVPYTISALVSAWILMQAWNGIFSQFLNGLGKIKLQMYLGISAALLNVPLAIYLGHKIGMEGVLLANIIVSIVGTFLYPIQYYKLINNKAVGIFNK